MPTIPGTRKRKLSGPRVVQATVRTTVPPTVTTPLQNSNRGLDGIQITVSEGHPWPPPKKAKLEDRGGPFYTRKSFVAVPATMPYSVVGPLYVTGADDSRHTYRGPLIAFPTQTMPADILSIFPPDLSSSDDDLDERGATAIARCEPTNSVADLSTALSELLREGLPSLVGSQTWRNRADGLRKNASGEYLNVQFGLAPLLKDISNVAMAIKKSDEILAQYERDAGRVVRRRYYFPSERTEETVEVLSTAYPSVNGGTYPILRLPQFVGRTYRTRETVRQLWFSGAFTYALPSGYDSRNRLSELTAKSEKLFGLKADLETLWNIAPWSWAIDWFANTGDVIHNLEAFKTNGLILRYGYVMEHTVTTDSYNFVYNSPSANLPRVSRLVLVTETKKRRAANPFGFGVSWNGLSPFQLSIAAALGLNRGRR